ncbi:unnamed protein product [Calicophoron daubneyi]|uniref:NR LBD domain-containing protein n=1 Tax=Calicophoron daubneyi TaxID=300641 RepID=A0AAV2TZT3_CALDB
MTVNPSGQQSWPVLATHTPILTELQPNQQQQQGGNSTFINTFCPSTVTELVTLIPASHRGPANETQTYWPAHLPETSTATGLLPLHAPPGYYPNAMVSEASATMVCTPVGPVPLSYNGASVSSTTPVSMANSNSSNGQKTPRQRKMVLDEDKRLAKRRLIEANRARKRAESEGSLQQLQNPMAVAGPSPPKQSYPPPQLHLQQSPVNSTRQDSPRENGRRGGGQCQPYQSDLNRMTSMGMTVTYANDPITVGLSQISAHQKRNPLQLFTPVCQQLTYARAELYEGGVVQQDMLPPTLPAQGMCAEVQGHTGAQFTNNQNIISIGLQQAGTGPAGSQSDQHYSNGRIVNRTPKHTDGTYWPPLNMTPITSHHLQRLDVSSTTDPGESAEWITNYQTEKPRENITYQHRTSALPALGFSSPATSLCEPTIDKLSLKSNREETGTVTHGSVNVDFFPNNSTETSRGGSMSIVSSPVSEIKPKTIEQKSVTPVMMSVVRTPKYATVPSVESEWTRADQDLVEVIRKAYCTIHFVSSENEVDNITSAKGRTINEGKSSESGKNVVQCIVDSHVTGFLSKLDDVEQEDIRQARAFYSDTFCDLAYVIEPMIARLVAFAKMVPGFGLLGADDQLRLLRDCCLDLITLRAAYLISLSARSQGLTDHSVLRAASETPADTPSSTHQMTTPPIPTAAYPRLGSSDEKCAQVIRSVAFKMARLGVDQTEVALMAAILLMSPDRSDLADIQSIENTQNTLLETFNRHVNRTRRTKGRSGATHQCWPRIIMALTELRSITMCTQELFLQEASKSQISELPWYFHELFLGHGLVRTPNRGMDEVAAK